MGGGLIFRGVARVVGAAAVGAAVTPSTGAFCHVRPSPSNLPMEQESLLAVLDDAEKEFCDANLFDKDCESYVNVRYVDEDSDTDRGETSNYGVSRQLVFYPPTEEEVEEATNELHAAFHLSLPAQGFVHEEISTDKLIGHSADADDIDLASTLPKTKEFVASTSSSQSFNHLGNLPVESSSVMQAFQLWQTNPKVKDVVQSLARDPAVWNAVLSNEKLLELTREESPDSQDSVDYEDEDFEMKDLGPVLASKLHCLVSRTKIYYSYMRGKLFSILNGIFGSMEKTLWTKGHTTAKDKTVASCMMLTFAVVILVVVRRSLKKG